MIHILTIFGTRPEAIKLAPVVKALEDRPGQFHSSVCVTAQHREMLDQVLRLFHIKPDHDLNIMKPRQDLSGVTSEILIGLRDLFQEIKPDLILVQGDTTTTFAASLAAFYGKIRVGHVEAGLRTHEKYKPFPGRDQPTLDLRSDRLSLCSHRESKAPSPGGRHSGRSVFVTGNTVIDALLWILQRQSKPEEQKRMEQYFLGTFGFSTRHPRLILVTAHRRESFGEGFENICRALKEIALKNPDVQIVYPVHLNPNVQEPVRRIMGDVDRIHLIEPIEYEPFVYLMNQSFFILTDSGGIQEEAPSLGKPVLVMREVTERPEAMEAGTARLVGSGREGIVREAQKLLEDPEEYGRMANKQNPYGDGKASERIADLLTGVLAR